MSDAGLSVQLNIYILTALKVMKISSGLVLVLVLVLQLHDKPCILHVDAPHSANKRMSDFNPSPDPEAIKLKLWASKLPSPLTITSSTRTPPPSPPPPPRSSFLGMVLCCAWGWPCLEQNVDACTQYDRLVTRLESQQEYVESIYCYRKEALHVTIATMSAFNREDAFLRVVADENKISRFQQAWLNAVDEVMQSEEGGPLTLTLSSIDVSSGAGFMYFQDPSNRIESLRKKLREKVLVQDSDLYELDRETGGLVSGSLITPDIIHSSFMRYTGRVPDPSQFQIDFERLKTEEFNPQRVYVDGIACAMENVAYMHGDKAEMTLQHYRL